MPMTCLGIDERGKSQRKIRNLGVQLHDFVEFDGPIMLDSGAFNFLKHAEISIDPQDVLTIGTKLGADISVVLDHPLNPKSDQDEQTTRWSSTVANTRSMFEALTQRRDNMSDDFRLMPVLHGYNAETLKRSLDDIFEIWGRAPDIVGIGSLAPLALNGSKRTVIDIILAVRRLLPDAHIHCFFTGFSSTHVIRFLLRRRHG